MWPVRRWHLWEETRLHLQQEERGLHLKTPLFLLREWFRECSAADFGDQLGDSFEVEFVRAAASGSSDQQESACPA
jgi:hypothetical protein